MRNQLQANEFDSYYKNYINKASSDDIVEGLLSNLKTVVLFFKSIPDEKLEYRYAEGKWTIKEVLHHIIDTERIFSYRALRIAREDKTPLAGFEQDDYVVPAKSNERTLESLLDEFIAVRNATIILYKNFNESSLKHIGTASNASISVRAIGYIITGHENHHCEVIKERYL